MKNNESVVALFLVFAFILNACAPNPALAFSSTDTPEVTEPAVTDTPVALTEAPTDSAIFASMSELQGTVQVKLPGQDAFTLADPSSYLVENSQVQTGDNGRVRLDLSTGTIIRVPSSTIFSLLSNTPTDDGLVTRLQLLLGQMFIILNGGSLDVETPSGVASVRGSYMSVVYYPETGKVRITCLEGHCSLKDSNDEMVEITAGETAEIAGTGQPPQVGTMSDEDIQVWLNNSPEAQLIVPTPTDPSSGASLYYVLPTTPVTEEPSEEAPPATEPISTLPSPTAPSPTVPPLLTPVVVLSINPTTSALPGETISFLVNVLPSSGGPIPTGAVIIVYGPYLCNLSLDSAGSASCSGTLFTPGNYTFYAVYPGDANYVSAQSASVSYPIIGESTTTSLNNPIGPSTVNEPVAFTAFVTAASGTPTGSVTFSDGTDSCTATSAPWTCNIAFTSAGTKNVTATYSGDGTFNPSTSNPISQTVNPYATTLSHVHVAAPAEADFVPSGDLDLQLGFYIGTWPVLTYPTGTVTITEPISGNSCNAVFNPTYNEWYCTIVGAMDTTVNVVYAGDSNFDSVNELNYPLAFLY